MDTPAPSQSGKFKQAAECDEDEARWDEPLKKIARQKPAVKSD